MAATINFSRKNYADYFPEEDFPKDIKMVGNTIKSKKMPDYIAKFLEKGIRLLERKKGQEFLDEYYKEMANSKSEEDDPNEEEGSIAEKFEQEGLKESENMYENISSDLQEVGIDSDVELSFTAQYVKLDLSGAILFNSGSDQIMKDTIPLMEKISKIVEQYNKNIIDVEGHTDNVPMHSAKFENNDVLSMYRALTVADFIRTHSVLNPAYIRSSGRGEYVPIADNTTAEGRARNRRVEIKIYNSYNSKMN